MTQRQFALGRGWKFNLASHGGGKYIQEQNVPMGESNSPGIVYYEKKGDKIFKKNSSSFGPGDLFNSLFHIMSVGAVGDGDFTPQYSYWKRPAKMDDGGENLNDSSVFRIFAHSNFCIICEDTNLPFLNAYSL